MQSKSFHIKLDSNVIHLNNIENFIGKEVVISIVELPQKEASQKKQWAFLGASDSGKNTDHSNIRDLAYD